MNSTLIWILGTFVAYMLMMLLIGAAYMKTGKSSEEYFLGGRSLGGWVVALSAQASDMSGWLLMGLPGSVYALGTGQMWIAVGLFLGTVANWLIISGRLRRYTIVANNSLTLPEYFQNRFHDKKKILLGSSSVVIVIFFLVYTASAFASGGKLFSSVFGCSYHLALTISAVIILAYTFMGGFMAVCVTDFIQGMLMIVALVTVPVVAYGLMGGDMAGSLAQTGVDAANFLNVMKNGDRSFTAVEIISQLAWGLGYCGMPHILVRFMAVKNQKELNKSKGIAIIWVIISLAMAVVIGVIGRAYLYPTVLGADGGSTETVFIEMITRLFTKDLYLPVVAGLFLCGILAAIMSTADSQLLVTASSMSEDIYKGIIKTDATEDKVMKMSRYTVLGVAILAYLIAWDPNSSIMGLVSNAWAGLGAAFGPTVLMSLFWKRCNLQGAVAGIVSGGLTVIVWDYIPLLGGQTLGAATGLYSLAIGFLISIILIVVVSLCTKAPDASIIAEFERVASDEEI